MVANRCKSRHPVHMRRHGHWGFEVQALAGRDVCLGLGFIEFDSILVAVLVACTSVDFGSKCRISRLNHKRKRRKGKREQREGVGGPRVCL